MDKIRKRTKTALFTSLIATVIMPFSSMRDSFTQQTQVEEDSSMKIDQ